MFLYSFARNFNLEEQLFQIFNAKEEFILAEYISVYILLNILQIWRLNVYYNLVCKGERVFNK